MDSSITENSLRDNECSICLNFLAVPLNIVITECGHIFHTSCLMSCIQHNGFDCPYCRAKLLAESYPHSKAINTTAKEPFDDDALSGMRFFFQIFTGEKTTLDEDEDELKEVND